MSEAKTMTKGLNEAGLPLGSDELQFKQKSALKIFYPKTPQMGLIRELKATLDDTERLADCLNEWSEGDSWGGSFGNTKFTAERLLKEWFAINLTRRMVVDEKGILQGYCSVDEHWTDEDAMYVELLGVRPSQQKRGFGKGLLLLALETAILHGKRRLDLHTWAGNLRAVPVYKKTGFMWCPNTSVLMENFLPAIFNTTFFESFFIKNDWYKTRELIVSQSQDKFEIYGTKAYFYRFIQDDQNSLTVYVDRHAKELSGFSYIVNGKELSVHLIPNNHEAFLGIDSTSAELRITNQHDKPISIKGTLRSYKGIKTILPHSIEVDILPGMQKTFFIEVELNPDTETYILDSHPDKRTDSRFYANLSLDGKDIQLAVGWVPKDTIQVTMSEPSAYFGRATELADIPVGFRNMMNRFFRGRVEITGEGLPDPHKIEINSLESGDALETQVEIQRPELPTAAAWRWKIQFYQQTADGESALPPIIRYVSCFTKPGVIAYVNPHKAAIIENEQLRFEFDLKETNELKYITMRDIGEFPFGTFAMGIGKPFPDESSEFWRLDRPYEIIHRDIGVSFKQTMKSIVEKPGLQVVRWINVDEGKPFISCYYEMTNTSAIPIENLAIRHWSPWRTPNICLGTYILPLKTGWYISDDPEFNDSYDFPLVASEYAEPWLAKENKLGVGCGLIWDSDQVDSIRGNPFSGPMIDTKSYTLHPGETIKLGCFTWVFGKSIAHLTRNIWINEFNGKKAIQEEYSETADYGTSLLEVQCGQDLAVPDLSKCPLPSLNWLDVDSGIFPIKVLYQARRETPIEIQIDVESDLWGSSVEWKLNLDYGIDRHNQKEIPINKLINFQNAHIFTFKGVIHLPYTSRPFSGAVIPYKSSGNVTLEKNDDRWLFSNNFLSFQTSPTHGASLFSANFCDNKEYFFSRFPNRESFVWFKRFLGGFHPFVKIRYHWNWLEFFDNVWSGPILVEKDRWVGLSYHLDSPVDDFRLKNIGVKVTYYTRSLSPLLWGRLSFENNSGITTSIDAGFFLFLKPIQKLITRRHGKIWSYTKTEKERTLVTIPPDNWAIASYGDHEEKITMISTDPAIPLRGDYMNANSFSELVCYKTYKLAPGETRKIDVPLIFSKKDTIEDLQTVFSQLREIIHL